MRLPPDQLTARTYPAPVYREAIGDVARRSDARNAVGREFAGPPSRPIGISFSHWANVSLRIFPPFRLRRAPAAPRPSACTGMRLCTVMLYGATSVARVRAKPVPPPQALDSMSPSTGCLTASKYVENPTPPPLSSPAAPARKTAALVRSCAKAAFHISGVRLSNGPLGGPPEFHQDIHPANLSKAVAAMPRGRPDPRRRDDFDHVDFTALSDRIAVFRNASSPRAQTTRLAPSAASSSAIARPSPRLLADTNATLPRMPRSTLSASGSRLSCRASPGGAG